ncbi:MAG TPA: MarR family transcriptional regulator [Streptosporangiaceae bacterium]|nr:MarR family transcriptional regulator [Streptosporangiaceae bacterium]
MPEDQPPGTAADGPGTTADGPGTTVDGGPEPEPGASAAAGRPYGGEWEVPWAEPFVATDPDRAELAAAFAAAIRRTGSLMQLMNQAAADRIGINSTDLNCLNILSFRGQMTAGELARETGLTTASITGVLDRLEEAGYVRRERDPQDRRRVVVRLVLDRALRDVAAVFLPMMRDWNQMAGRYSDDELRLIVGFYDRMEEVLRGHLNRLRERPAARKPG